jgi:hypothetical protein
MTESKAVVSVLLSALEHKQGDCQFWDVPKLESPDVTITRVRGFLC